MKARVGLVVRNKLSGRVMVVTNITRQRGGNVVTLQVPGTSRFFKTHISQMGVRWEEVTT